jgi:hypothetical protein
VFYGRHEGRPEDKHGVTEKPGLAGPGTGAAGFGSLAGYRWDEGAAVIDGAPIANGGGRDFFGNAISTEKPRNLGAHQGR